MYDLFAAHMRAHLVDKRSKERRFALRDLKLAERQSPRDFGLRVECELLVNAPACSIPQYARMIGRGPILVPGNLFFFFQTREPILVFWFLFGF